MYNVKSALPISLNTHTQTNTHTQVLNLTTPDVKVIGDVIIAQSSAADVEHVQSKLHHITQEYERWVISHFNPQPHFSF